MFKRLKSIILIISILISGIGLSGCFDRREIDDLAYVVAMGMDLGKSNVLKLTLQIALPLSSGGGGESSGGGGGGSKPTTNITVEAPTLYSGLNMANATISKEINMSHLKLVVFSEEMARKGLHKYLHAMFRGREFRPTLYVTITSGSASKFLEDVKPVMEASTSKFFELIYNNSMNGFITNTTLGQLYFQQESDFMNPVIPLSNSGKYKSENEFDKNDSTAQKKDRLQPMEGDYVAGNLPKVGENQIEVMGSAVFRNDKMIGTLDGEETTYYLLASGQYNRSYWTLQDPEKEDLMLVLNIRQNRSPQYKVSLVDGKPDINLKILLEGDIMSIQSGIVYEEKLSVLEKYTEQTIKNELTKFLKRTQDVFNSDIIGFGKYLKGQYLTLEEWKNADWSSKYKNANFNITVDFKVRRSGLMVRTEGGAVEE